jgi:hypothetical protein
MDAAAECKFAKGGMRCIGFILTLVVAGACKSLAAQAEGEPATQAEQFQTLLKAFYQAANAHFKVAADDERKETTARVDKLTSQCLELAEKNPGDPIALDAMVQVVTQEYWLDNYGSHPSSGKDSRQAKAIVLILRHHLQSDKLAEACRRVHYGFRQESETFLRTVLANSPHREVQALACLRLAQFLVNRRDRLDLIKDQPELARRYDGLFGKDYIEGLQRQDRAEVIKEAEALYNRASEEYGDVKIPYGGTLVEQARTELFEIRYLAIGKQAPDIVGADQDGKEFKLSDYRGKVVLLYFWSEF